MATTGANIQSQIDVLAGAFVSEHINITNQINNINGTTTDNLTNIRDFLSKDGETTTTYYLNDDVKIGYDNTGSNGKKKNLYGVILEEVEKQALQHVAVKFQKHVKLTDDANTENVDKSTLDKHYENDAVISLGGSNDGGEYVPFSIKTTTTTGEGDGAITTTTEEPVRLYNAALSDVGGFIVGDKIITANGIFKWKDGEGDKEGRIIANINDMDLLHHDGEEPQYIYKQNTILRSIANDESSFSNKLSINYTTITHKEEKYIVGFGITSYVDEYIYCITKNTDDEGKETYILSCTSTWTISKNSLTINDNKATIEVIVPTNDTSIGVNYANAVVSITFFIDVIDPNSETETVPIGQNSFNLNKLCPIETVTLKNNFIDVNTSFITKTVEYTLTK